MGKILEFLKKVAVVVARNAGVAIRKIITKSKKKKTSRRKSKR